MGNNHYEKILTHNVQAMCDIRPTLIFSVRILVGGGILDMTLLSWVQKYRTGRGRKIVLNDKVFFLYVTQVSCFLQIGL